jgi:hypothetical protein
LISAAWRGRSSPPATLHLLDETWQTDAVEMDQRQLPNTQSGFMLKIHPHEIVTLQVVSGQPVNKVEVQEP